VFVVALETGLRRGDLLGLKWSNVKGDHVQILMRKTKKFVEIPLSTACREALEEIRGRLVVGEHVFLTESGQPYSVTTIRRYFDLAKTIAGIKRRFRFHDLRHTFGSTLASRGVSIQVIAKAMGQSTVRLTERYARPSEEAMKSVLDALNGSLHRRYRLRRSGRNIYQP
jgi:integrase